MLKFIKTRSPFLWFLVPYLALVFFVFNDFGVAIDEPLEYDFGRLLYNRNFGKDPVLIEDFAVEKPGSREIWAYNHFHAMVLYMFNDAHDFDHYHLLNLLFATAGFYCAYELAFHSSRRAYLSLIAPLFLFLTPRFFGDLPSNIKDPVFAIYFLVSLAIVYVSKHWPYWLRVLLVGLSIGFLTAARFVGYAFLPIYAAFQLIRMYRSKQISFILVGALFLELCLILVIAILIHGFQMPYVAADPLMHLLRLSQIARSYPWVGTMLYMGQQVHSTTLPWHYLPVWIWITTPLYVLVFWIASHRFFFRTSYLLLHLTFWVNVIIFFMFRPVVYDGLRHMLFLVVIMSILAAKSWMQLFDASKSMRRLLISTVIIFIISTFFQYYRLHPYQYVYFNEFAGGLKGAATRFETDYWGLSYREGATWLTDHLKNDEPAKIGVCGNWETRFFLEQLNNPIIWIPDCAVIPSDINYVLANARNGDWKRITGSQIHAVERIGVPLMKIYQID
jgi:hypothetical protein